MQEFNVNCSEIDYNYKNIQNNLKNKFEDIDSVISRVACFLKNIGQSVEDYYGFEVVLQGLDNKIFETLNYLFSNAHLLEENFFSLEDPDKVFKYAIAIHPFLFPHTDDSQASRRQTISDESPPPISKRFCNAPSSTPVPLPGTVIEDLIDVEIESNLTCKKVSIDELINKIKQSKSMFLKTLDYEALKSLCKVCLTAVEKNNGKTISILDEIRANVLDSSKRDKLFNINKIANLCSGALLSVNGAVRHVSKKLNLKNIYFDDYQAQANDYQILFDSLVSFNNAPKNSIKINDLEATQKLMTPVPIQPYRHGRVGLEEVKTILFQDTDTQKNTFTSESILTSESVFIEGLLKKFNMSKNDFIAKLDKETATSLMRVYFHWRINCLNDFLINIKNRLNIGLIDLPCNLQKMVSNIQMVIGRSLNHYRVEVSIAEPHTSDYTRTWNALLGYSRDKAGGKPNQDVIVLD